MIINMVLNLLDKSISHFISFEAKPCGWKTILHFIVLIKTNVFLGAEAVIVWEAKAEGSLEIRHLSYNDNPSLNAYTQTHTHSHTARTYSYTCTHFTQKYTHTQLHANTHNCMHKHTLSLSA